MTIERRALGRTGIECGRLGLAGSYGIDGAGVERAFHELGVNYFFVTARAKELIAALHRLIAAGHRDELVIASGASIPTGGSVGREFARMARLLGTDYLDVFQLFWVQAHWYVTGKTWPAMRKLKEEGKARALGMSIHDRKMARSLVDELDLDMLMIRYNAAHRGAEKEIFATLPAPKIGVVAYTATRWGKLLAPLGDHKAMSAPECYRFALGHPSVDVVLCGAKSYAELAENAAGLAAGPLDPARLDEVKKFGDAVRAKVSSKIAFAGG